MKISTRGFSNSIGELTESHGLQFFNSKGELTINNFKDGLNFTYSYDLDERLKESLFLNNGKVFSKSRYNYKNDGYGNRIERKKYTSLPNTEGVNPDN